MLSKLVMAAIQSTAGTSYLRVNSRLDMSVRVAAGDPDASKQAFQANNLNR